MGFHVSLGECKLSPEAVCRHTLSPKPYLEGQGDLVSRLNNPL